jgi:hypothetical protein
MRIPYPPNPPSSQPAGPRTDAELKQAWMDEIEDSCERGFTWYESSIDGAELAEELDLYRLMAIRDKRFERRWYFWDCYIIEHDLSVPIEQSCDQGVLLPLEQRHIRLLHCPERQRSALRGFFVNCQLHVQHYLALRHYLLIRIARHHATGKADWSPATAPPRSVYRDNTFFRPQLLRFRNYAR